MSDYEDSFEADSTASNSSVSAPASTSANAASSVSPLAIPTPHAALSGPVSTQRAAPVLTKRATEAIAAGAWRVQQDPTTGRDYYYNVSTHKTTWDLNEELRSEGSVPTASRDSSRDGSKSTQNSEIPDETQAGQQGKDMEASSGTDHQEDASSSGSSSSDRQRRGAGARRQAMHSVPLTPGTLPIPAAPQPSDAVSPTITAAESPSDLHAALNDFQAFKDPGSTPSSMQSSKRRDDTHGSSSSTKHTTTTMTTTTTDSGSTDNHLSLAQRERKAAALAASQGEAFKHLNGFVAFGSPPDSATGDPSSAVQRSGTPSSRVLQDTSTDSRNAPGSSNNSKLLHQGSNGHQPLEQRSSSDAGAGDAADAPAAPPVLSSAGSSSIFSAVSHGPVPVKIPTALATPASSAAPEPAAGPSAPSESAPVAPVASAPAQAAAAAPFHKLSTGGAVPLLVPPQGGAITASSSPLSLLTTSAPPAIEPPTQGLSFTMPPLAPMPPLAAALSSPSHVSGPEKRAAMPASSPAFGMPPTAQEREEAAHQRRIEELRETSHAVERLVHAFAALKSRPAPPAPPNLSNHTTEHRDATPMHKIGAASTVRTRSNQPVAAAAPRPSSAAAAPATSDERAATLANEKILEDALGDCILSMMAERRSGPTSARVLRPSTHRRPARLCVSADEFSSLGGCAGPAGARRGGVFPRAGHLSVFDGEMSAFAPPGDDESADAAVQLRRSIETALEKYLWARVAHPPGSPEAASRHQLSKLVPFVTPHVAWALLLDAMAACCRMAESSFSAGSPDGPCSYPVLVRYDGPAALEEVARAVLHCLPFEALSSAGDAATAEGEAARKRRTIFRLEYWVTRPRLFTVVEAIHASLRHHLVTYANELHYSPFNDETEAICIANGVVPSHTAYFCLVPTPREAGTAAPPSGPARRYHKGEATPSAARDGSSSDPDVGLGEAATERLAHVVASLATDMLRKKDSGVPEELLQATHRVTAADFPLLCTFVAETASELFEDVAIRAALERRAAQKLQNYYAKKGTFAHSSRLEKEKELIESAEAEAQGVVSRILQELDLQRVLQQSMGSLLLVFYYYYYCTSFSSMRVLQTFVFAPLRLSGPPPAVSQMFGGSPAYPTEPRRGESPPRSGSSDSFSSRSSSSSSSAFRSRRNPWAAEEPPATVWGGQPPVLPMPYTPPPVGQWPPYPYLVPMQGHMAPVPPGCYGMPGAYGMPSPESEYATYAAVPYAPAQNIVEEPRCKRQRCSSESGSLSDASETADQPSVDWVCGLCGNPNAGERVRCLRCNVKIKDSYRLHTAELEVRSVPPDVPVSDVVRAMYDVLQKTELGKDKGMIVDADSPAARSNRHCRHEFSAPVPVYLRFRTPESAAEALRVCRCTVSVAPTKPYHNYRRHEEPSSFYLRFSDGSHTQERVHPPPPTETPAPVPTLPPEPPAAFPSPEKEKAYLDTLSAHWSELSAEQKRYYDEAVKAALCRRKKEEPPAPAPAPAPAAVSLSALKEILAARKAASAPATTPPPSQPASSTPVKPNSQPLTPEALLAAIAQRKKLTPDAQQEPKPEKAEKADKPTPPDAAPSPPLAPMRTFLGFLLPPPPGADIQKIDMDATSEVDPCGGIEDWASGSFRVSYSSPRAEWQIKCYYLQHMNESFLGSWLPRWVCPSNVSGMPIKKTDEVKKKVEWDEQNLEKNAEYQRLHPVTMHIDEPKTPYAHIDDDVARAMDEEDEEHWDPKVNAYVKQIKERITGARDGPVAPIDAKTGRPQLAVGTVTGELLEEKAKKDFSNMRKAVYADEGAKFRAMLAKANAEVDEDEEQDTA
eukprot:gene905-532_t